MPEFILETGDAESHAWLDAQPEIVQGYLEALFFTGVTFDTESGCEEIEGLGVGNLDAETRDQLAAQAVRFWIANAETLARACDVPGYDMARAGNDLWYTRNGHGVGFWDSSRGLGDIGDALTAACLYDGVDLFAVPLDPESLEPLPGFHADHNAPSDAGPDLESPDLWRVYLSTPDVPLLDVERAALDALQAGADPGAVRAAMPGAPVLSQTESGLWSVSSAAGAPLYHGKDKGAAESMLPIYQTIADNNAREALALLCDGPQPQPLARVGGRYGAPMGRAAFMGVDGESVTVRRVTLDSGGYDAGGAYWGIGAPLWRVVGQDGDNLAYIRAQSSGDALAQYEGGGAT